MTTKHTPGPWVVDTVDGGYLIMSGAGNYPPHAEVLNEHDATLIAAAPDLLSVCRRLERFLANHSYPELQGIADENAKAIAKAEGR